MAGTKLTHTEVDERVDKCLELRYQSNDAILFKRMD